MINDTLDLSRIESGSLKLKPVTLDLSRLLAVEGQLELSVIDTGLGLSATQLSALFQPYNRLVRENSGTPGVGLGLIISRRLAEMMGGALTVTSVEGCGSCVLMRSPCARAADILRQTTIAARPPD